MFALPFKRNSTAREYRHWASGEGKRLGCEREGGSFWNDILSTIKIHEAPSPLSAILLREVY